MNPLRQYIRECGFIDPKHYGAIERRRARERVSAFCEPVTLLEDFQFDPAKHPRDERGRFVSVSSGAPEYLEGAIRRETFQMRSGGAEPDREGHRVELPYLTKLVRQRHGLEDPAFDELFKSGGGAGHEEELFGGINSAWSSSDGAGPLFSHIRVAAAELNGSQAIFNHEPIDLSDPATSKSLAWGMPNTATMTPEEVTDRYHGALRDYLQAQYEVTQNVLEQDGVPETVTLYRGIMSKGFMEDQPAVDYSKFRALDPGSLCSMSPDRNFAKQFGDVLIKMSVPRSAIVGTGYTGLGVAEHNSGHDRFNQKNLEVVVQGLPDKPFKITGVLRGSSDPIWRVHKESASVTRGKTLHLHDPRDPAAWGLSANPLEGMEPWERTVYLASARSKPGVSWARPAPPKPTR